MTTPSSFRFRRLLWPLAIVLALGGAAFAYLANPALGEGLRYEVFVDGLDEIAALAFDAGGNLYATQEHTGGKGRVVRIRHRKVTPILDHLDKPDGLLVQDDALYVTSEAGRHGLLAWKAGVTRVIDGVANAEGIAGGADGTILVIEDRKADGRLLRVDPASAVPTVLLAGLHQAEGVCETPAGQVYLVAKSSPSLQRFADGKVTPVADGLVKPAFVNCLDDGAILITEDRTHFGRLLRYSDGQLQVLAAHLHAPQAVVVGDDGAYYLAEQNRQRILRIHGS